MCAHCITPSAHAEGTCPYRQTMPECGCPGAQAWQEACSRLLQQQRPEPGSPHCLHKVSNAPATAVVEGLSCSCPAYPCVDPAGIPRSSDMFRFVARRSCHLHEVFIGPSSWASYAQVLLMLRKGLFVLFPGFTLAGHMALQYTCSTKREVMSSHMQAPCLTAAAGSAGGTTERGTAPLTARRPPAPPKGVPFSSTRTLSRPCMPLQLVY